MSWNKYEAVSYARQHAMQASKARKDVRNLFRRPFVQAGLIL